MYAEDTYVLYEFEMGKPMSVLVFVLLCLASYRITRIVTDDEWPPSDAFREWVFNRFGPVSAWAKYITCHWCFGTWVAVGATALVHFTIYPMHPHWGLWAAAVAGAVGLIGENLDG